MRVLLLRVSLLLAPLSCASKKTHDSSSGHLQYFGFWGDQWNSTAANSTAAFTNLHHPYGCRTGLCHASEFPPASKQLSLVPLRWLMWNCSIHSQTNGGLKANWRDEWAAASQWYAPMIANGSVGGFDLGDEIIWQGCTVEALHTLAEAVRADFPDAPIYYNENVPVVLHGKDGGGATVNFSIPPALTWFSFDYYHYNGDDGGAHVATVRQVYEQHVYPKLLPHQRILLCPGAFAVPPGKAVPGAAPHSKAPCQNVSCYDAMRADDAARYWDWAVTDERIAGLVPWEWSDGAGDLGAANLPQTRAAWEEIGRKIVAK